MFVKNGKNALFSIYGSYIVVKDLGGELSIETIAEGENNPFFTIGKEPGDILEYHPSHLTVKRGDGYFQIALHGLYDMSFAGTVPVKLCRIPNAGYDSTTAFSAGDRICVNNCRSKNVLWFMPVGGRCTLEAPWQPGAITNDFIWIMLEPGPEAAYDIYLHTVWTPSGPELDRAVPFGACRDGAEAAFSAFCRTMGCRKDYDYEAAYVLWSSVVGPSGNYSRDTVVSSKYGMARVWSWDNCFAALGVAHAFPELAWDMFMLPYAHQFPNGYVPDCITPCGMFINCVKPPVKGWFFRQLAKRNAFFRQPDVMREACGKMAKETDWWLSGRDFAPCYWHGNDSGADNATCFDEKSEMKLPELYAFLAVQSGVVAELAEKLGETAQAEKYHALSEQLAAGVEQFWDGKNLFARRADNGKAVYSQSLLLMRTAVLGKRLPAEIREYIIERLETKFLGNAGLASEAPGSEKFDPEGYWRGAVWPADQIIYGIVLRDMGADGLADKVLDRFLAAARENGYFENYDVRSGRGLRCPNYIWGAAANFIFADDDLGGCGE